MTEYFITLDRKAKVQDDVLKVICGCGFSQVVESKKKGDVIDAALSHREESGHKLWPHPIKE